LGIWSEASPTIGRLNCLWGHSHAHRWGHAGLMRLYPPVSVGCGRCSVTTRLQRRRNAVQRLGFGGLPLGRIGLGRGLTQLVPAEPFVAADLFGGRVPAGRLLLLGYWYLHPQKIPSTTSRLYRSSSLSPI
jgi:hypothetical protein